MPTSPDVSIIIPAYNRAHTLGQTIRTALDQTHRAIEIIVADDESTDNTAEIVRAIVDPRLKYLHKPNGGASAARNFGVAHAVGTWVMYLDSDDQLLPECVEVMLAHVAHQPQAVFAFPRTDRALELYENGQLVASFDDSQDTPAHFSINDIFMRHAGFSPNGFMHLRSIHDEGFHWDENLASMEDWEFMMTLGEAHPGGFVYVPVVLARYRQRFGSDNEVSKSGYQTWANAFEHIYQRHTNDKQLAGQTWYPSRVQKWQRFQTEYEAGTRPPYQYHYFPDYYAQKRSQQG